jgi:hypothetical protein
VSLEPTIVLENSTHYDIVDKVAVSPPLPSRPKPCSVHVTVSEPGPMVLHTSRYSPNICIKNEWLIQWIKQFIFPKSNTVPYTFFWNWSSVTNFWLPPTVSQDVPAIDSCHPGISLWRRADIIRKFGDVTVHSIFQIISKNVLWEQSLENFSV